MPKQRLQSMLEKLDAELDATDTVGEQDREAVVALLGEIRLKLDAEGAEIAESSVTDRLRESVERFEGEHPTLSESLMRLIDQLAKLGI